MPKPAVQSTTLFSLIRRADLALASRTADLLTGLAFRAEAWRRKLKDEEFSKALVDYALVSVTCLSAGALLSLLTAWFL